jgi:hypothetical protein
MRLMDQQQLDTPFFGVGQFTDWLHQKGHEVNPKRVRRSLRLMWDYGQSAPAPTPLNQVRQKNTKYIPTY